MNDALLHALRPASIEVTDGQFVASYNRLVDEEIARSNTPKGKRAAQGWRLRGDLGALSYDGALNAPVVYLQANPSHGDDATRETHYQPHPSYPLSIAGPHVHTATGDYYRNTVFRHIQAEGITLEQISYGFLKVELCPWASKNWPGSAKLQAELSRFPSRKPIGQLVEHLVERGALFIMARAWTPWFQAVPSLEPLIGKRVFKSRAPVSASISSGSYPDGWAALVTALRSVPA